MLPVASGAPFAYSTPTPLPVDMTKYITGGAGLQYDVSRDGQRFLVVKPLKEDKMGVQSLTVVTHWFDEFRAAMKGK